MKNTVHIFVCIFTFCCVALTAQEVITSLDGRTSVRNERAARKTEAAGQRADEAAAAASRAAVTEAIARLKKSAASNQDIADILLLLRAINQNLNQ